MLADTWRVSCHTSLCFSYLNYLRLRLELVWANIQSSLLVVNLFVASKLKMRMILKINKNRICGKFSASSISSTIRGHCQVKLHNRGTLETANILTPLWAISHTFGNW